MAVDVFLSYGLADRPYVRRLAEHLETAGLSVWYDQALKPAERWSRRIEQRIKECTSFVIVMSPAAAASHWVEAEFNLAVRLGKRIAPLLLEGEPIWYALPQQHADVRGGTMPPAEYVSELGAPHLEETSPGDRPGGWARRRVLAAGAAGTAVAAAGGLTLWWLRPAGPVGPGVGGRSGGGDGVTVTEPVVLGLHHGPLTAIAYSPDGGFVVTASADSTARAWRTVDGEAHSVLAGHGRPVTALAYSRAGRHVATASQDGDVRIWNGATFSEVARIREEIWSPVTGLTFLPDQDAVLLARARSALIWDFAIDDDEELEPTGQTTAVAVRPQGDRWATGEADGTVTLWDEDWLNARSDHTDAVRALVFSPDGGHVTSASADGTARIWTNEGAPVTTLNHPAAVTSVAYSADGSTLATGCADGRVRVWRAATGDPVRELSGHPGGVDAVVFSPDPSGGSARLASGGRDGVARVWRVDAGGASRTLRGHAGPVLALVFSPDGGQLATASADGTGALWPV